MVKRDSRLVGNIYQLGQVLTSSGPLSMYTAFHRYSNAVVGLFLLELPLTIERQRVEYLLQPLERRRAVQSSHVMRVYDWGIDETRIYIATDPPRGLSLRYVMDNENIDPERAFDLVRQMAQGLQVLHEHGVVGIDLRPQLVTVDTVDIVDRVQLDDISLRWLLNGLGYMSSQQVNDLGSLNPAYAPPEYLTGGQIGPWSDIYQLGLILFELMAGRLPFVGRTQAETGVLQSTSAIPRVGQYQHDASPLLQGLIDHTLAKNPAERFLTASAFLKALDSVQPPLQSNKLSRDLTQEMIVPPDAITLSATSTDRSTLPPQEKVPAEPGVYAYLCYEKDGVEIERFAIRKENILVGRTDLKRGSDPEIDLTPLDPTMTVSRPHARITYEQTFFSLEDLRSHNHTRLGDVTLLPLKSERLQDGDIVQFGAVRLVFRVPDPSDKTVVRT